MFRRFPNTSCHLEWLQGWINFIWQGQNCCFLNCLIVVVFPHSCSPCMRAHAERGHERGRRALVSEILCLWYNYFISKIPIKLLNEIHTKDKQSSAGTRRHPFKLHMKIVLTNQYIYIYMYIYIYIYTNRVINKWNNPPPNIVLLLAGTRLNSVLQNHLAKHWEQK